MWEMVATSLHNFFLIPKNATSECPIALMPTMIRWWESLRNANHKYRVERRRDEGAERTVCETLLEMEKFHYQQEKEIKER